MEKVKQKPKFLFSTLLRLPYTPISLHITSLQQAYHYLQYPHQCFVFYLFIHSYLPLPHEQQKNGDHTCILFYSAGYRLFGVLLQGDERTKENITSCHHRQRPKPPYLPLRLHQPRRQNHHQRRHQRQNSSGRVLLCYLQRHLPQNE